MKTVNAASVVVWCKTVLQTLCRRGGIFSGWASRVEGVRCTEKPVCEN